MTYGVPFPQHKKQSLHHLTHVSKVRTIVDWLFWGMYVFSSEHEICQESKPAKAAKPLQRSANIFPDRRTIYPPRGVSLQPFVFCPGLAEIPALSFIRNPPLRLRQLSKRLSPRFVLFTILLALGFLANNRVAKPKPETKVENQKFGLTFVSRESQSQTVERCQSDSATVATLGQLLALLHGKPLFFL